MNPRRIGFGGLLSLALALSASAQTIPFQLLVTQPGQSALTVQDGGTVGLTAAAGQTQTAQLVATYTGTGQVTISQQPNVTGSTAFTAKISGTLPITVNPGSSFTIALTFSPTTVLGQNSALLALPYAETVSATVTNTNAITLALQGIGPSFALSYELQTVLNFVPIQSGGTIPFPPTLVGTTAQAALDITNSGSGPGSVTNIAITGGTAFALQGVPIPPTTVAAGQTLPVLVLYQPTGVSKDTGQVTITFASGTPAVINLTGSGSSATFTYEILGTNPPTTVAPGGSITLPSANLGQTTSVTLQVLNSGNASGTVNSISVGGQGFGLGPVVVPQTLASGASLTFTINFTATQPGTFPGTLIINSTIFNLSGIGLGPLLTFSYVANGNTITLGAANNNTVVFSPVQITQSKQISLDVKNTGTLPATISNIGIQPTAGPFAVTGEPPQPVTLAPNADFQVTLTFTPTVLGVSTATLLFDTTSIAIQGSGTQPPPLPSYTITGPSGNAPALTQQGVGLTLASPYPVALNGTLALSVTGTLPADQAVQFITGGTTVAFTIPANQTSAVFGSQGTQLGLQTGTVASNITITPTFVTQAGDVPLTPTTPQVLQFSVAPAAPTVIALQVTGQTTNGFTIQVTGFSTTRSLTSLTVQFAMAKGYSMPTSQFTIPIQPIATVWFGSTASQAFGGQFTVAVPFTFQGVVPAGQSILSAISSISVTMANATGSSTTLQAAP